jgi:hypothetical protein
MQTSIAGCGKRVSVMLSGAKHLHYLLENKQMQMLRSAQDGSLGDFFHSLLEFKSGCEATEGCILALLRLAKPKTWLE